MSKRQSRRAHSVIEEQLTLDVKRGLYAIIYGDNGATAFEVNAARAWLKAQGIEPQ